MAKISRVAGRTSQIVEVEVLDSTSTTGSGKTGLLFNTSGLTCYYKRNTSSASTLVSLATITTLGTFATSGFKEVDATHMPGLYEFHPPNAALASGADTVTFIFTGATGAADCRLEIELTATDNQDAVHGGMTALPNAAANAPGGLPVSIAGALDLDEMNVDIEAIQTGVAAIPTGTPPTSAVIAAAVWDLATSGHTTAGTFGAAMTAAASAGDPWGTFLPGAYAPGTAGHIVGTAIPDVAPGASGGLPTTDASNGVKVSVGTGTGQINVSAGVVPSNVTKWLGGAIPAVNVTGVPLVDLKYTLGTLSPAAAGYIGLDWGQVTNKTATNALTGTTISTAQAVASVSAAVTVSGYSGGQDPATLVLEALATAHNNAGTIGAKINNAASAGDPFSSPLPGAYAAGTAGYIIGNNLNAQLSTLFTTALTESYPALHAAPTLAQAVLMILQKLMERSISGTTETVKKINGSTTAYTSTLDSSSNPTATTRAS